MEHAVDSRFSIRFEEYGAHSFRFDCSSCREFVRSWISPANRLIRNCSTSEPLSQFSRSSYAVPGFLEYPLITVRSLFSNEQSGKLIDFSELCVRNEVRFWFRIIEGVN